MNIKLLRLCIAFSTVGVCFAAAEVKKSDQMALTKAIVHDDKNVEFIYTKGKGQVSVKVLQGDMLSLGAQAVVNPAGTAMQSAGGVSGLLYNKAGIDWVNKYKNSEGFNSVITSAPGSVAWICDAGNIARTKYMVSVMAPIGLKNSALTSDPKIKQMYNAYYNVLTEVEKHNENAGVDETKQMQTIVFPFLGVGIYGCDLKISAQQMVKAMTHFIQNFSNVKLTTIYVAVLPSEQDKFYAVVTAFLSTVQADMTQIQSLDKLGLFASKL